MRVLASDVSMYSCGIGHALQGTDGGIRLRPEAALGLEDLLERTSPLQVGALMMFFSELAVCRAKRSRRYYAAMADDLERNRVRVLEKLEGQLTKARSEMGDGFEFRACDGLDTMLEAEPGDLVFFDPPFFAKGYEKMFAAMNECFSWRPPSFQEINSEIRDHTLLELSERGCIVYVRPLEPMSS